MRVSLNWLTDYVDVAAMGARELADVFTRIGLCCDGIDETDSDVVFELEVTCNRPDCLGHIGVARELSSALGLELKLPDLSKVPSGPAKAADLTAVEVLDPDLCPRYTARVLRGVTIRPSPSWMVERLEAVGLRGINNVVDVTNYVMMEYGQPLHSFDQSLLKEGRIVVRRGRAGEEIVSIDGTHCPLSPEMLVIADAEAPVAVAGIMGGLASEVRAETTDILLEAAQFDPLTTRRTARALSLMSESSYRFERGVDPVGLDAASLRACQLILQTGGGELAEGVVDVWAAPYEPPTVKMRTARCRMLLGVDVPDERQVELLGRLGLAPRLSDGAVACKIPPHRPDLTREADLIEEVARLHGYDKIPTRGRVTHAVTGLDPNDAARRELRSAMAATGFDEAITFSFVDDAEAELFGFAGAVRVDPNVRRSNNLLRPTLVPSLLRACKNNQDVGNSLVSLYELAAAFPPSDRPDGLPEEYLALAMVTQRDLRVLRGALEAAVERVAPAAAVEVAAAEVAGLAAGASAEVRVDGRASGIIGMVDAKALDYYGLEKDHAAATIDFGMLLPKAARTRKYQTLPRFPAIRRDLSIIVDEPATWGRLAEVVAGTGQPMLEAVEYVGAYRGKQVPKGRKSLTLTLVYRSSEGTLRHEQVDEMVGEVLDALGEQAGAELRK